MGDYCVVRFIGVKMEGCPRVWNVSPPSVPLWKSDFVFIWPRNRVNVQRFCAMPKFSPVPGYAPLAGHCCIHHPGLP